ncbi:MAG: hypothetical protein JXR97_10730 [Planctomycetes bacterium]|nr:hypothetical protein [Planctomycetota bacterium]
MALFPAPGKENPQIKLYVLAALMAVVTMGLFTLENFTNGAPKVPPPSEQEMVVADENGTVDDPFPDLYVRPNLEKQNMIDFVSEDDEDLGKATKLFRYRPAFEEGFAWFKGKSNEEIKSMALPRWEWNFVKIMRDVNNWRFQILHVYGMLLHYEKLELVNMPKGLQKLHLLILINPRTLEKMTVLTPLMPKAATALKGMSEGSYLACDGLYLKRHVYVGNDGIKHTPMFLAKRVYFASEPISYPERLDERGDPGIDYKELKPEHTVKALDIPFIEQNILSLSKSQQAYSIPNAIDAREEASDIRGDKPALDHIFEYIYSMSDEEIANMVNPEVTYLSTMAENLPPHWMVGKITRFRGIASRVITYRFPKDTLGIKRVHLIIGHDLRLGGPDFTWAIATLNLPKGLREDDEITADGVFVKLYPYKTPEQKWHWSPLIVCKDVNIIERTPPGQVTPTYIVIAVAAFTLAFLMYWASNRDSKGLSDVRQRVLQRRIAHDKKVAEERKAKKETEGEEKEAKDIEETPETEDTNSGQE